MNKKKIFLTGASGFFGKNLFLYLKDFYSVLAPTSSELDLLDATAVKNFLKQELPDVVLHCATWNATQSSDKDSSKVFENNLRMFFNLARCSEYFAKMIYYGSGAEYDKSRALSLVKESDFDTFIPQNAYGYSKYIMAKYAQESKSIINLRAFGVFGPEEDWRIRFISNVICKVIFELPITIRQNVKFDYLDVRDLCKITHYFLENDTQYRDFNLCRGQSLELKSIVEQIIQMTQGVAKSSSQLLIGQTGFAPEYSGNHDRLLDTIGPYDFIDFSQSLSDLYQWYLDRKDMISVEVLKQYY